MTKGDELAAWLSTSAAAQSFAGVFVGLAAVLGAWRWARVHLARIVRKLG